MLSSCSVTCTSCINFHREFSGQDPGFVPIHALHTWKYAIWGHWRHSSAQSFPIHYIDTRTATLIYDLVFSRFWLCIATRLCILSHNALRTVAAFLFLDRTILIGHQYLLATRQLNKYSNFVFLREGFFFLLLTCFYYQTQCNSVKMVPHPPQPSQLPLSTVWTTITSSPSPPPSIPCRTFWFKISLIFKYNYKFYGVG